MRRTSQRFGHFPVYLLAVMLLLTAVYSLYWYAQMRNFKASVVMMQNGHGALFDVEARNTSFSGFPYRLQVNFEGARLVRQRPDYVVALDAPHVELTRLLWSPDHWVFFADQPKLELRSRGGSAPLQLGLEAAALQSSLRYSPQKIERLSFDFSEARWTEGHPFAQPVTMKGLQFHLRDSKTSSAQGDQPKASNVFANLRMIAGGAQTSGSAPLNMDFYADLTGGEQLADKLPALASWQARGGAVAINQFILARPGLTWQADGKFGLSAEGTLSGRGKLRSNAQAQTLRLLGAGAKAGLPADANLIDLPWQLTNGALEIGGIAVKPLGYDFLDNLSGAPTP